MAKTTGRKGKQDDKFSLAIREVQGWAPENKKCFDCDQRGPTYINITVGSFVCTKCSGMLRGMNPPHRIKSISMSTFTPDEVEFMRTRGNAWCSKVWLARWDPVNQPVDFKDDEKVKDFMVAKYEKRLYYSEANEKIAPTRSSPSISSLSSNSSQDNKPLTSLIGSTIKAHMAANHTSAHSSSSVIPRSAPSAVPRPLDKLPQPPRPAQPPPFQQPTASSAVATVPAAPAPTQTAAASIASTTTLNPLNSNNNGLSQNNSQQQQSSTDAFANFANFETAAFDSLPPDPLAAPPQFPADTLPPIKKNSQGTLIGTSGSTGGVQHQSPAASTNKPLKAEDRYSALKELDDLFRSANIQSPAASDQPPAAVAAPQQQTSDPTAGIFGSPAASSFTSKTNGASSNIFADLTAVASDITGGSAAVSQFGRLSPAAATWNNQSQTAAAALPWGSPAASGGGSSGAAWNNSSANLTTASSTNQLWGSNGTLTAASSSSSNLGVLGGTAGGGQTAASTLWAGTNGSTAATAGSGISSAAVNNSWNWNSSNSQQQNNSSSSTLQPISSSNKSSSAIVGDVWAGVPAAHQHPGGGTNSTNPFGTSPSNSAAGAAGFGQTAAGGASVNFQENNNDLFAAAPKPFNDKSGNPWSSNVPVFTQNMTPAPNPNNPFL
eukprot:TRINITY_DN4482_c0_g1_i8.p1 TRINITY_DN4482_c0_g1~~TRINITY_DN4482_c0_g1_i8.p1  ORF type:complete len:674 (-),score=200.84 TRINITY_DN4482_c0_g1_i8:415-2403(-)